MVLLPRAQPSESVSRSRSLPRLWLHCAGGNGNGNDGNGGSGGSKDAGAYGIIVIPSDPAALFQQRCSERRV